MSRSACQHTLLRRGEEGAADCLVSLPIRSRRFSSRDEVIYAIKNICIVRRQALR